MAYTTTALLASIKRRANIPTASGVFDDTELLAIASEELRSYIVPLVTGQREDYWHAVHDVPLTASATYALPRRAMGGKLREVAVLDAAGREYSLPRLSTADLEGAGDGFYFDSRGIHVHTLDNASPTRLGVTLRMRYVIRPAELVAATDTSKALQVVTTTAGASITHATPGTWTPATNELVDVVIGRPPFDTAFVNAVIGSAAASVVTLKNYGTGAAESVAGIKGSSDNEPEPDWLCKAGYSPVPQCPLEFMDCLAQKVAIKVAESKNQQDRLNSMREELGRLETDARALVAPRVDGEPVRAVKRGGLFRIRW